MSAPERHAFTIAGHTWLHHRIVVEIGLLLPLLLWLLRQDRLRSTNACSAR